MTLHARNFIAGEWVAASDLAPDVNPSNTAEIVGHFPRATKADTERAIAAARAAFAGWSRSTLQERHDILKRISDEILARKDELGAILSREEGKTLAEGIGEVARAGQIFRFFAGEALRLAGRDLGSVRPGVGVEVTREPVGVIGLITPWNFPMQSRRGRSRRRCAYGNTRGDEARRSRAGSAWALGEIIARSGVPPGVFNLVMGRGSVVGKAC